MFQWIPYAFLRIVLFFIGGILLGIYLPDSIPLPIAVGFFLTFILSYLILFVIRLRRRADVVNGGFIGLIAIFLAGYINLIQQTGNQKKEHIAHLSEEITFYKVKVSRYPQEKEKTWKVEADVTDVRSNSIWTSREGKVLLYFPKKVYPNPFSYGDVLLLKGSPQVLMPPQNPGEFDYKRFLSFRNIYHQQFIREGEVYWIENDPSNMFMSLAIQTRLWADAVLCRHVSGKQEQGIASALILGITDDLDNDLLNAYSATGAMHVLSVSGLHVGIIYMILLFLLRPVTKMKSGKWIIAIISIFILWAYAFVTGLSPSVLRAVTMFSFVALAQPWNQRTNIYNTLAASAFCLLLYDPYMIMSVGFQLSYLAVLGIVYLQPIFYAWWEPKTRFWDEVWKITCVSMAAQIATFSLGLLYFHQFPNYFLISNLLVIPISFGVLVVGLTVLATSIVAPLAFVLGMILEWLIKAMNFVVFTVEDLPFSLISNIYITTTQCWLLILMIVSFILLFEKRKLKFAISGSAFVILFSLLQWQHFQSQVDVSRLTVYKVSGHSAIDLMDRGQTFFVSDSVLFNDAERMRFHINPNRLIAGIQQEDYTSATVKNTPFGRLISWKGKTILVYNDKDLVAPDGLRIDYLIISNNAVKDLNSFLKKVEVSQIILDSSNSYYYSNRILKESNALPIFSVLHQGAYNRII